MKTTSQDRPARETETTSQQTLQLAREGVRDMLLKSAAFRALPTAQQRDIAKNTVEIVNYLAAPEGIAGNKLAALSQAAGKDPYAFPLAEAPRGRGGAAEGQFTAQAAREGAAVAGALLTQVNFPEFVRGLIDGVFTSIVDSSIRQMEAYGQLVKSVAQTLNQFRDENVSANQGRDYLVEQFPDTFELNIDTGDFGEGGGPRVRLRDGVDESAALQKVNSLPMDGGPMKSLDLEDDAVESQVVQAARTQLATSRQQLLATMVLMGINRIVVTDGKISAKVLYDFRAQDNFKYRHSATKFDYDPTLKKRTSTGEYESDYQGGESEYSRDKEGSSSSSRGASYYAKGNYKYEEEPVMTLASATQASTDAALQTKASLAGSVEVNFKSETFPLEKMADSFQIGMIQNASKPKTATAGAAPAPAAATPAPAATTPTPKA